MTTILYGISNCDTVKKAKKWLEQQHIDYQFHDFRKDGISTDWVKATEQQVGIEVLLNKRGTTFRQLDEHTKQNLDTARALELMAEHPTLIKRPVLYHNDNVMVGFKADSYAKVFNQ
ncbi:ArsC family reductase [Alteromonas flava]|uniref:ArsC family reductase n=1 Tax=Alteromonas flava TaxID=2048003 RepID=UPI000C293D4F|nr:ArsC family reductase [Alteromonas flava]